MADSTGVHTSPPEGGSTAVTTPPAPPDAIVGDPPFQPYIPSDVRAMPEFTLQAVLVGAILGIVFGASSLYLVLKVGMTVSASIPVAVLSITLFRAFSKGFGLRPTTILENNIVQTTGSAGESIAFGVGVTMPALLLIGFEMDLMRIMVVSVLGGLLGILMMIPLRRAFIVKLHGRPGEPGKLLYPEGTACAQVLISAEKGGTSGKTVFIGFGIAFVHKFLTEGMNVLRTTLKWPMTFYSKAATLAGDCASELLGVGYIIGFRTSAIMMAGAVLGTLVLGPTMIVLSDTAGKTDKQITEGVQGKIKSIGAGCVAAAGIISMGRTLPMILGSLSSGLGSLRGARNGIGQSSSRRRTNDDMSMTFVFVGCLLLLGLLTAFLYGEFGIWGGLLGSLLVLLFGFLFVTVSSRLTGEIGSSSNPISGMTVATLLLTCLIFLALGMTSPADGVLALSIGGVVCIAASNGGTTSQDLKTGYLVGGTPRWQQWAIIVGALTSAVVIGGTLLLFSRAGIVYSQRDLPDINLKEAVPRLTETESHEGQTFHVWRAKAKDKENKYYTREDAANLLAAVFRQGQQPFAVIPPLLLKPISEVKPGKYLVDDEGRVRYYVDPTITGNLEQRDTYGAVETSKDYLADGATVPEVNLKADVDKLKGTVSLLDKDGSLKVYRLWKNVKPEEEEEEKDSESSKKAELPPYIKDVKEGEYLVDDQGQITHTVEGKKVRMKFEAPKTQVMGIIINGLLKQNLNWTSVLIGAFIAIALELCGVSSLAFAVGLYVPMQYSVPIFVGGLVRWGIDAWSLRSSKAAAAEGSAEERAAAEVTAIAKLELSPAVLLASGLIAGGSLAGVLIAFMEFLPESIKELIDQAKRIKGTILDSNSVAVPLALAAFGVLVVMLVLTGLGKLFPQADEEIPPANLAPPERKE